jgi:hypothetical protein
MYNNTSGICLKLYVLAKVANKVSLGLGQQIPPPNQPKRHAMGVKPGIGTVLQRYKNSWNNCEI